MANLHRRPTGTTGHVHHITPEDAGWGYVAFDKDEDGFAVSHLGPCGVAGRQAVQVEADIA
ncbi:MAG: hypothetical protein AAFO80_11685, partial [Pseudomonadota bacterium]